MCTAIMLSVCSRVHNIIKSNRKSKKKKKHPERINRIFAYTFGKKMSTLTMKTITHSNTYDNC